MANRETIPIETDQVAGQVLEVNSAEGGFDIGDARRERTTQAVRSAGLELDHLKKLLAAQDAAKLYAQSVAAQLQREVKSTETDNNRMRIDIKRLQDQLAVAKQEQGVEIYQASERESILRKELLEVRAQLAKIVDKSAGHGKKWLMVALAVIIPAMILAAANQWHSRGASADATATDDAPPDNAVVASKPADKDKPATRDFAGAMGRLDKALDSFKGEKPEAVLLRVHLENAAHGIPVCSFEWNNGQISMLFGSKEGLDIDKAMARCADAVEKAAK